MGCCSACLLLRPTRVSINGCNKPEAACDELLRLARRRLARYEATGDLLRTQEPQAVTQVQAVTGP
jgi:hypothetical protein